MKKTLFHWILAFAVFAHVGLALATTYQVDSEKSKLEWQGEKKIVDSNHVGTIQIESGSIVWKDQKLEGGEFVVDMSTINPTDVTGSDRDKLAGHLKSPDFFEVQTYPTAKFKITKVKPLKDSEFEVTGDLTIKGKTHPNTFTIKTTAKGDTLKGSGSMTFDRSKYGVKYASESFFDLKKLGDRVIKDKIELDLTITAKKKS